MDSEIDKRIGKAVTTLARLTSQVWTNSKLAVKTKMAVYNACVISTLLYGSETWTTYARQERRLNSIHMRNIRRILRSCLLPVSPARSLYSDSADCHIFRMEDGRNPKDILYGELSAGG